MKTSKLFVLSGPSGVGKSTIILEILAELDNIAYSISATTRTPRHGELEGKNYFFVSKEEFESGIKEDRWLEWAEVHGNYYGTPISFVNEKLDSGEHVILEIDIQGAKIIKEKYPSAIFVFIAPPTFQQLAERLEGRGTDSTSQRELRLFNAQKEMAEAENYDYIIINDDLNRAVEEIIMIVRKEEGGSSQ